MDAERKIDQISYLRQVYFMCFWWVWEKDVRHATGSRSVVVCRCLCSSNFKRHWSYRRKSFFFLCETRNQRQNTQYFCVHSLARLHLVSLPWRRFLSPVHALISLNFEQEPIIRQIGLGRKRRWQLISLKCHVNLFVHPFSLRPPLLLPGRPTGWPIGLVRSSMTALYNRF